MARALLVLLVGTILAGCDAGSTNAGGSPGCRPGEVEACMCGDGREGVRECGSTSCACPALPALRAEPASLDFGEVPPGASLARTLAVFNPLPWEVRIRSATIWGDDGGVFDLQDVPRSIPAEGSAELDVEYAPAAPGSFAARIRVEPDDAEVVAVEVILTGRAPGAVLSCTRGPVSFGRVWVDEAETAEVRCSNSGLEGTHHEGRLVLDRLEVEGPSFSATWREDPPAEGLPVGGTVVIDLAFAPAFQGIHRGTLAVAGPGAEVELELYGEAEEVPACDLEIRPERLDVATLPGETRTAAIVLANRRAEAPCTVRNLRLCPGTDPAFSLPEGPYASLVLPGAAEVRVPLEFAPGVDSCGEATETGCVEMELSPAEDGYRAIPLACRVGGEPSVVVVPDRVDFGALPPGCGTRDRWLEVMNPGGPDVVFAGAEVADGSRDEFFVRSAPPAGTTLPPGFPTIVEVAYRPVDVGVDVGDLLIWIEDRAEPFRVGLRGEGQGPSVKRETWFQARRTEVDLLLVLDNGSSMVAESQAILSELGRLPEVLRDQWIDARLAVTTTGLVAEPGGGCPGGVDGGEDGRFFPVDGTRPRILDENTPDLLAAWQVNLAVGTCHTAPPQGLEAALRALTPPLSTSADDPRHDEVDDGNLGFLRNGSHPLVIVVSDRADASPNAVESYIKAFDQVGASVMAITGDPGTGCTAPDGRSAEPGDRLLDVASTGSLSICDDDWADRIPPWGPPAMGPRTCFHLAWTPDDVDGDGQVSSEDLQVRVDGEPVLPTRDGERVWEYHGQENAVCFALEHRPGPGAAVEAEYEADLCPEW